jgi:hypothetical protein
MRIRAVRTGHHGERGAAHPLALLEELVVLSQQRARLLGPSCGSIELGQLEGDAGALRVLLMEALQDGTALLQIPR